MDLEEASVVREQDPLAVRDRLPPVNNANLLRVILHRPLPSVFTTNSAPTSGGAVGSCRMNTIWVPSGE
jgi:hypothetical protein